MKYASGKLLGYAALILAVLSLVLSIIPLINILAIVGAVGALIIALIAISRAKRTPGGGGTRPGWLAVLVAVIAGGIAISINVGVFKLIAD